MKKINSIGVIDDDPITVFGIKKMLNALDVSETIKTYANGKEAIDDIKEMLENKVQVPEVIFLDINMPIMDGWQFLEEFITLPLQSKIRINILTSSIDPADRQNWVKPITSLITRTNRYAGLRLQKLPSLQNEVSFQYKGTSLNQIQYSSGHHF